VDALKRLLAAVLTLFLCAAPVAQAQEMDLLKELYQGRGQTVVSPVSLNLALLMAAEGAKGETRAQLLAAAGVTEDNMADYVKQAMALADDGLTIANAAFVKGDLAVLKEYDAVLKDRYQAERFAIDGSDVNEKVNAWVKEKTGGLIDPLLTEKPDPNLMMMLVNALALKADWSEPFEAEDTFKQTFHATDGDVDKDFMHETSAMPYAELPGMKAVRLTYADSPLGLTVILPDKDIASALDQLTKAPVDWSKTFGSDPVKVALALPKLSLTDTLSLVDTLKALGVQNAFDDRADFSGIDGTTDLLISSVLQKTRLDIDEKGTTAAAATSIGISAKAAPMTDQPVDFTVDRPYILLLTDSDTGLTLFVAAIDKP
jgi:serpin B